MGWICSNRRWFVTNNPQSLYDKNVIQLPELNRSIVALGLGTPGATEDEILYVGNNPLPKLCAQPLCYLPLSGANLTRGLSP